MSGKKIRKILSAIFLISGYSYCVLRFSLMNPVSREAIEKLIGTPDIKIAVLFMVTGAILYVYETSNNKD